MIVLDAEWPTDRDGIWMVGTLDTNTNTYTQHENAGGLREYLRYYEAEPICGHRIVYADLPRLRDHWGIDISDRELIDTYTLSTLFKPGVMYDHSLAWYGETFQMPKLDFTDYDGPAEGQSREDWWRLMGIYMEQDVRLTLRVYEALCDRLQGAGFSQKCIVNELLIAKVVQEQIDNGFFFDIDNATQLYVRLTAKHNALRSELQEEFPPITVQRFSDKTGKELKPKVTEFNPGSRQQIADRLIARGVKLTQTTPTGQYKISDEILEHIQHPSAKLILEYMMIEKRIGQLDQWIAYYNENTHRIHGKVNPLGTNTHRQSQSKPNLAQIPSCDKPYGRECRSLFTVPEECLLVGVDASALELRLFANLLRSQEYKEQVLQGDIHTYNMEAAGLHDRQQAKTFIYAFLYGAGDHKLASILNCTVEQARRVRANFTNNIPGFKEFKADFEKEVGATGKIKLLDGSVVWAEEPHKFLNYKLQGDGAVAMKQALLNYYPTMKKLNGRLVVQAHDEWQIESPFHCVDIVGKAAVKSIEQVSEQFGMFVPLTGEYQVGRSWADTH
jgi:DNA polymerase I-like protein with 3'-5' exonuclease and polymerase domains